MGKQLWSEKFYRSAASPVLPSGVSVADCRHLHICPSCMAYKSSLIFLKWNIRGRNRCDVVWGPNLWLSPHLDVAPLPWCSREPLVPGTRSPFLRPHRGMRWGRCLIQSTRNISLTLYRAEKHLCNKVHHTVGSNKSSRLAPRGMRILIRWTGCIAAVSSEYVWYCYLKSTFSCSVLIFGNWASILQVAIWPSPEMQ